MNKDPFYGVISEEFKETDFQLGAEIDLPRASGNFEKYPIQYNQKEVSPVSCTIHGAMGAISSLTGHRFSLLDRKGLWQDAIDLGADPNLGWYTGQAVDLVRKFYNRKFNKKLTSFKVHVGSEEFFKALRLGYRIVVSYRGNSKYNADRNEDGILDGLFFGITTYGHCLTMSYSKGDEYEIIIDNYEGQRKFNVYKIPSANLKQLISNGIFYRSAYVFVDEYVKEESPVPIWALQSWKKALDKGIISQGDDPMSIVADDNLEAMLIRANVFQKDEAGISLVRWIVAMDRMGLLD